VSGFVPTVWNAPPFVEALIAWQAPRDVAQVPLPVAALSGPWHSERPRMHRHQPGHDRTACRRALRFHVVVIEANALACQFVDPWSGRGSAVHTEGAPPHVVHKNKNILGFAGGTCAVAPVAAKIASDNPAST
jgi:hypothetical protein